MTFLFDLIRYIEYNNKIKLIRIKVVYKFQNSIQNNTQIEKNNRRNTKNPMKLEIRLRSWVNRLIWG